MPKKINTIINDEVSLSINIGKESILELQLDVEVAMPKFIRSKHFNMQKERPLLNLNFF